MFGLHLDVKDDAAENSIMQTITIAVSAILIAAGLVTAPGLINNARDSNVKGDLANLAYAEEYINSDSGKYTSSLNTLSAQQNMKTTLSGNSEVGVFAADNCYAIFGKSTSGKYFYRTSESAEVKQVSLPWSATKPADYPANCTYPTSASNAVVSRVTNLVRHSIPSATHPFEPEFGGATGTSTFLSDDSIGTQYQRSTWTSPAGLSGFPAVVLSPRIQEPLKANTKYTFSMWVRSSVPVTETAQMTLFTFGDNGVQSPGGPGQHLEANKWTHISYTFTTQDSATNAWPQYRLSGETIKKFVPGATLDATQVMFTEGDVDYEFANGDSIGWSWSGEPGNSTSSGYPNVH
jgi:hypothetical protein